MRIATIRVKDLCFAHLLEGRTGLKHHLNGHLIEDLGPISVVISQVEYDLNRPNPTRLVCPAVNGLGDLLNASPVDENVFAALSSVLSKLVCLHPLTHLVEGLHGELSTN